MSADTVVDPPAVIVLGVRATGTPCPFATCAKPGMTNNAMKAIENRSA
jgi:hypothetical protein